MSHRETDVNDRCPRGGRCESCGSGSGVTVVAVPLLGEVGCLTLCGVCRASVAGGQLPAITLATAAKIVAEHREHVAPVTERRVIRLPTGGPA